MLLRVQILIEHIYFDSFFLRRMKLESQPVLTNSLMDHHVFRFATRGQCIKGKKLDCFEHNHIFCFNCNVLALLSFYALPSGGNQKTRWSINCNIVLIGHTNSKVTAYIGLTSQLYRNANMSNLNFYGTDVKGIFN